MLLVEDMAFPLDGDRTLENFVFQEDADHQEHEVEAKHDEAQYFVHAPLAEGDGKDDKEQHDEEEDDGAEEAVAADGHGRESVDDGVEEPGQGEPERKRSGQERKERERESGQVWRGSPGRWLTVCGLRRLTL